MISTFNVYLFSVVDLRHHIEEIRGMLLNKEERKVFFQVVLFCFTISLGK